MEWLMLASTNSERRTQHMRLHDSAVFAAVFLSFATSVYLWFSGQRDEGLFVGLWVPSILGLAVYIKLTTGGTR